MKRIFLSLIICFTALYSNAQWNETTDSAEMGAGYLNNVYYSFLTGEVAANPTNNWHVAFRSGLMADGIRINSASASGAASSAVTMYLGHKGDTSNWSTFDTAGYKTWDSYQNSNTTWEIGAMNQHAGMFPDVSWGVYDMGTHAVTGDAIYLLEYKDAGVTKFKKLTIISKIGGSWVFRYADIDGSNEKSVELKHADIRDYNYTYFNLSTDQVVVQEPKSAEWDIVFTRYNDEIAPGMFYPSTGVLSNVGVEVAQGYGEAAADQTLNEYIADTSDEINTIGADWKKFDNVASVYYMTDSVAYFVKDRKGIFWKMTFSSFDFMSGKIVFNKTQLTPGLNVAEFAVITKSSVYPNPSSGKLKLTFDAIENTKADVVISNINGAKVYSNKIEGFNGMNEAQLDISHLNTGVYFLEIKGEGFRAVHKIVKN